MVELIDFLKEMEDITDVNGCYFINVEESKVITSTISYTPSNEILWELCVLRDTFRQFASGIKHGDLLELMIEGDKGYIILYNIPPKLILLAMASDEINLSYLRLAILDIIPRIRKSVEEFGEELIQAPEAIPDITVDKPRMRALEEPAILPTTPISAKVKAPAITAKQVPVTPVTPTPPEVEAPVSLTPPELEAPVSLTPSEVEATVSLTPSEVEAPVSLTPPEVEAQKEIEEGKGLEDLIKLISIKVGTERMQILRKIFDEIKIQITKLKGNEISRKIDFLKDAILENMGTSLALFDISKCAQDLSKLNKPISPDSINRYQERVENWAIRIIK